MAEEIVMPRLSDTMEEGTVAQWLKHEGDEIKTGDIILTVETDKATMELPAYSDGVLAKILVQEGTTVPLGAPIGIMAKPGEQVDGAGSANGAATQAEAPAAAPPQGGDGQGAAPAQPVSGGQAALDTAQGAAPVDQAASAEQEQQAAATAREAAPSPEASLAAEGAPSGDGQRAAAPAPVAAAPQPAGPAQPAAADTDEPLRASPLARRVAEDEHLDLHALAGHGSGPSGRIVAADVQHFLEEHLQPAAAQAPAGAQAAGAPAQASAAAPQPQAQPQQPSTAQAGGDDIEWRKVSRVHQVMAKRMLESVTTIPAFYLTSSVDMTEALALRKQLLASLGDEGKVSINDLVIRAVALALREVPEVNSTWRDGQLGLHTRVHVGVAVAIADGLVVPVIDDADKKTAREIAVEMRELAGKAREGKLSPQEMDGGTFTISNLGMFDVESFLGIINPPQAGLLAVGTAVEQPVVVNGEVTVRSIMKATLSGDHRAYSGDVGARFLQAFKRLLQQPLRLGF